MEPTQHLKILKKLLEVRMEVVSGCYRNRCHHKIQWAYSLVVVNTYGRTVCLCWRYHRPQFRRRLLSLMFNEAYLKLKIYVCFHMKPTFPRLLSLKWGMCIQRIRDKLARPFTQKNRSFGCQANPKKNLQTLGNNRKPYLNILKISRIFGVFSNLTVFFYFCSMW